MKDGFVKVAAASPDLKVAACHYNADRILDQIAELALAGAKIMVFPELAITSYTASDLFLQEALIDQAKEELRRIAKATEGVDALIFIGLPWEHKCKLYNVAAVLNRGNLLGLVPKKHLPNYNEFYELRHFTPAADEIDLTDWQEDQVPFGTNLLFACRELPHLIVSAEICEDLWVPAPPSTSHAEAGATVLVNLSASDEMTGKAAYRRQLLVAHSASTVSAYIYASSGDGESTQDLVFGSHKLIVENGSILAESPRFVNGTLLSEIDVNRLAAERRRISTYPAADRDDYLTLPFSLDLTKTGLTRAFPSAPFVPSDKKLRAKRCEEILTIQAMGLKKRLLHTRAKSAVIGISGGLDSTLALLVTVKAFDLAGLNRENIICVTMPGFGTTDRTYTNACQLTRLLKADLKEVDIKASVSQHFADIGHDIRVHDVTYENSQARERTQILMDIANQTGGLVIGTGDLSELALGWATYNGDHMSMYGVNASIPKTLVRYLVAFYADSCGENALAAILRDILDTPVSPELLPPREGLISQKTEDLVGPYELHDFFLYYMLRAGFPPSKIYRIARISFCDRYDSRTILKWLKTFYRRFFAQQFKRSALPDGPKVGSVALSPRGDLRMPSDACMEVWEKELDLLN